MARYFPISLLLISLFLASQPPQAKALAASAISWETKYETALDKAKNAGKPILIDFFSPV